MGWKDHLQAIREEQVPELQKETEDGLLPVNDTEPQDTMSYLEDSSFQYTEHQQES